MCWWFGDGVTPVLIPNTAVKLSRGDGSRKARVARRQDKKNKQQITPILGVFVWVARRVQLPHVLGSTTAGGVHHRYSSFLRRRYRRSACVLPLSVAVVYRW